MRTTNSLLLAGCLLAAAAQAGDDADAQVKAYHHASASIEPGVIFRAAVRGVRPDLRTGLLLLMVDQPVAEVEGLEACPSEAETGVPGNWLVIGSADDAPAAAAFSAVRTAIAEERRVYVEAKPVRHPEMGWCQALGITLSDRKR